jgi:hypothetical protein
MTKETETLDKREGDSTHTVYPNQVEGNRALVGVVVSFGINYTGFLCVGAAVGAFFSRLAVM